MRVIAALLLLGLLAGCIGSPSHDRSRRGPAQPPRVLDTAQLRQCLARLDAGVARYTLLPDREFAGGCMAKGAVQLKDIGTRVAGLGAMTCPLANAFVVWVQSDLTVPAMAEFGSPVVRISTLR